MRLGGAGFQLANHPRDYGRMAGRRRDVGPNLSRRLNYLAGQFERQFLKGILPSHRRRGARCERCERAQRRQANAGKCKSRRSRVVRYALEQLGMVLEGKTAVPLAMRMGTFK